VGVWGASCSVDKVREGSGCKDAGSRLLAKLNLQLELPVHCEQTVLTCQDLPVPPPTSAHPPGWGARMPGFWFGSIFHILAPGPVVLAKVSVFQGSWVGSGAA
jgi:hypothetical protein